MMQQILPLDAARYRRHLLHVQDRNWAETNCYVDVWIELLHAWGFEPIAALPFTLGIDFEGDQWTFFKFPHADLYELFGLDVQELAVWRPLVDHVTEQVARGRPILVELDSFYLPDTKGTAYALEHVKSTVAVNAIDVAGQRLGYFHNQGYYCLEGDDFANVFRTRDRAGDGAVLPPYVEFVKRRGVQALYRDDLVQASLDLLRQHLKRAPESNPFDAFRRRFEVDLCWLTTASLEMFHRYCFATLRQFGACFELAATYLHWLGGNNVVGLENSIRACTDLSTGAKTLQFQLARAITRKKPLDLSPVDAMAETWRTALTDLQANFSDGPVALVV
jgi:hypothetical protein